MTPAQFLFAIIVRTIGALFVFMIFYGFPAYMRARVQKFPDKRTPVFLLFPYFIVWMAKRMIKPTDEEGDIPLYVLQTIALLMLYIGIGVNLIGDMINDDFISSLGIEIIAAFVIVRTLTLLSEYIPSIHFTVQPTTIDKESISMEIQKASE